MVPVDTRAGAIGRDAAEEGGGEREGGEREGGEEGGGGRGRGGKREGGGRGRRTVREADAARSPVL